MGQQNGYADELLADCDLGAIWQMKV